MHYSHVIWVWMENHSYGKIIGSAKRRTIHSVADECGLATNYHNISHPSLPNYVSATSGLSYSGSISSIPTATRPRRAVRPRRVSSAKARPGEHTRRVCGPNCASADSGEYAVRHNPPPYFTTISGCSKDDVRYTQLSSDLAAGTLPAFSFVTPNLIDDMHDGTVADGDTWLSKNLPAIFASSEYRAGSVARVCDLGRGRGRHEQQVRDEHDRRRMPCRHARRVPEHGLRHAAREIVEPLVAPRHRGELLKLPELGRATSSANMLKDFNLEVFPAPSRDRTVVCQSEHRAEDAVVDGLEPLLRCFEPPRPPSAGRAPGLPAWRRTSACWSAGPDHPPSSGHVRSNHRLMRLVPNSCSRPR